MWIVLSETINILKKLPFQPLSLGGGGAFEFYHGYKYPSSDHSLLTLNLPFKVYSKQALRLFSDVWNGNAVLFKR